MAQFILTICSQLQPITLDILQEYSLRKKCSPPTVATVPRHVFTEHYCEMEASFLFSSRLRMFFRELTKRQTILLNLTETSSSSTRDELLTHSALPQTTLYTFHFAFNVRHCEPFSQREDYFPAAPDLSHCPLILIFAIVRWFPPLPFPQSRENALKQRFFFFLLPT